MHSRKKNILPINVFLVTFENGSLQCTVEKIQTYY